MIRDGVWLTLATLFAVGGLVWYVVNGTPDPAPTDTSDAPAGYVRRSHGVGRPATGEGR